MNYHITFSRPGSDLPYATCYQRGAGHYAPGELAPLGGNLELLPGNICGAGNLTLSRVPASSDGMTILSPRDWVRVYLDGIPDPIYLGEVTGEPWKEGKGEIRLVGLKDRISKAAWRSTVDKDGVTVLPLEAKFKPYLQEAISRCVLPTGITIGDIPDVDAKLRALTLFELLGDTMQAALPAVPGGGNWGANPLGQVLVHQLSATLTHRFVLGQGDTPPGELQNDVNCIRFLYQRPDGQQAFFEYRTAGSGEGEAWGVENLPSNLDIVLEQGALGNLTADLSVQSPVLGKGTVNLPFDPAKGMVIGSLDVVTGAGFGAVGGSRGRPPMQAKDGHEQVVLLFDDTGEGGNGNYYTIYTPTTALGQYLPVTPHIGSPDGPVPPTLDWDDSPIPVARNYVMRSGEAHFLRYDPAAVQAYYAEHGEYPLAFDVITASGSGTVNRYYDAPAYPELGRWVTHPLITGGGGTVMEYSWGIGQTLTIKMAQRAWQAGETVTCNTQITAVTLIDDTGENIPLQTSSTVDGLTTWVVPRNVQSGALQFTGSINSLTFTGRLVDLASLTAYAINLLRNRQSVTRSWVGEYPDLRLLDVSGMARFEHWTGDTDLQITRGVYDLTTCRTSIEAGTPQALDDTEALSNAFDQIERVQRLQNTPGGTP